MYNGLDGFIISGGGDGWRRIILSAGCWSLAVLLSCRVFFFDDGGGDELSRPPVFLSRHRRLTGD